MYHFVYFRMKIAAAGCLKGRRSDWGASRNWLGDYLSQPQYNPGLTTYTKSLSTLRSTGRPLFACRMHKVNRFNKVSERCLLVTETSILKLDCRTFKPMKKPLHISEVFLFYLTCIIQISVYLIASFITIIYYLFQLGVIRVMSSNVQLVVLGIPAAKNDLVIALIPPSPGQDLIGELIGILSNRYSA